MTNVSQISKAKRLTEEEVHEAAEELKDSGIRPSSIEVYKFLGRGSLTTITNFLKTWNNPDEKATTTLPALIMLPDALKKSAEQLILKVWAESQDLAEHEINSQREALKQAEALANEKIAEAEAFSEEQSKQIEALEAQIDELKKEKAKDHDYFLQEEKRLQKEISNGQKSEGILETRIFSTEKQLKAAEEKIATLEALIVDNKKFELMANRLEAENHQLNITTAEAEKRSEKLLKDIENYKEKVAGQINISNLLKNDLVQEKLRVDSLASDNSRLTKDCRELIEKAAKLEGELSAWKEIKPKAETKKSKSGVVETIKPETQTEWIEEK